MSQGSIHHLHTDKIKEYREQRLTKKSTTTAIKKERKIKWWYKLFCQNKDE